MSPKTSRIFLTIPLLIALSLACSLTGEGEEPANEDAQAAIATSVAATVEAGQAADEPESPPSESEPEGQEAALLPEANQNCNGVSFYLDPALASGITADINPGMSESGAEWWNTPEHRECVLNDWALADTYHTPAIRVYSVADFEAINPNIGERLDGLQAALSARPVDGSGLGVVDFFNAAQFVKAKVAYLDFQNGSGARWLSQYGQAAYPVGWPHLFYTFQGFTADGAYFISAILPVTHPSLPLPDEVVMDDAFYNNFESYAADVSSQLNGEPDESFQPSLTLLDQLVESLTVGE
jgi:hypothetical protein